MLLSENEGGDKEEGEKEAKEPPAPVEESVIETSVDSAMKTYDGNKDGFIEYYEFQHYSKIEKNKVKNKS